MYPGAEALLEAVASTATERPVAEAIIRKTTVDQVAGSALVAAEDAQEQLANPDFVAEREIDLAKAAILGNLQGLLPNENLATIEDAAKLGDDVVLARAMATQDLAAVNSWLGNAAIDSAKIKELVADKITAGILQAAISVSSAGSISAGGASLDADGLELLETASEFSLPSQDRASKITPRSPSPWAHYQFYRVPGVGWGTQIAAVGSGTPTQVGNKGQIRLDAFSGPLVGSSRIATLLAQGGDDGTPQQTFVNVNPHLRVQDQVIAGGALSAMSAAITAGLTVGGAATFGGSTRVDGLLNAPGTIETPKLTINSTQGVVSANYNPGGLAAVFGGNLEGGQVTARGSLLANSVTTGTYNAGGGAANFGGNLEAGVLAARGAVTAGGNITAGSTIMGASIRPQYVFGAGVAGDWFSVAPGGGVRHFTFTTVPHDWRVLYNTIAAYNGARPLGESTAATSQLDITNSRITVTNNSGATIYVNCVAWVFG